jgi:hypothetical protein
LPSPLIQILPKFTFGDEGFVRIEKVHFFDATLSNCLTAAGWSPLNTATLLLVTIDEILLTETNGTELELLGFVADDPTDALTIAEFFTVFVKSDALGV